MKPTVVEDSIIPKLIFWMPVQAITLFPFIFFRGKMNDVTLTHEKIHIMQFIELWVIGYPFVYMFDFVCSFLRLWNIQKAYLRIRMEQEAYTNQNDFEYPNKRKKFAWCNFRR
jgi:hypothetical protein